jgi:hypothetical protein
MQTIYKTASLGISELSGKVRYTQEHRELTAMKAQRAELDVKINKLEAALRKAGLESLKRKVIPVKWKVGDVVKCMCGDTDFALGRLYKIANISKDHIMLQTSPKKYKWTSVNNFKLIGGNHGTHSR